jgi:hypothetical protein
MGLPGATIVGKKPVARFALRPVPEDIELHAVLEVTAVNAVRARGLICVARAVDAVGAEVDCTDTGWDMSARVGAHLPLPGVNLSCVVRLKPFLLPPETHTLVLAILTWGGVTEPTDIAGIRCLQRSTMTLRDVEVPVLREVSQLAPAGS